MRNTIKYSLFIVLILIIVCAFVVIWNPIQQKPNESLSASTAVDSDTTLLIETESIYSEVIDLNSFFIEDSLINSSSYDSSIMEVSDETTSLSITSDLISEDQPTEPDLNYETSGTSYDDIAVNVLTCLLTQNMELLSTYIGDSGLQLSPTGSATAFDITLSAAEVSSFFSLSTQCYGTYPGSGEDIDLSPSQYYEKYIVPQKFDFSLAVVSYNNTNDLSVVSSSLQSPKTISYHYAPNVMEWKHLILVFESESNRDVLCGIIYQDVTTN